MISGTVDTEAGAARKTTSPLNTNKQGSESSMIQGLSFISAIPLPCLLTS
ncbi:hypothetical protein VU01_12221, partial [Candidatus Electrothrix marina]